MKKKQIVWIPSGQRICCESTTPAMFDTRNAPWKRKRASRPHCPTGPSHPTMNQLPSARPGSPLSFDDPRAPLNCAQTFGGPPWPNPPVSAPRSRAPRQAFLPRVLNWKLQFHCTSRRCERHAGRKLLGCGAKNGNDTVHPTRSSQRNAVDTVAFTNFAQLNTS